MEEIAELIERVVRDRFPGGSIRSVKVRKDTDHDDEAVLRVTVVYDQERILDAHKSAGLVRHIRHELLDREEYTFPIVAFVSKGEAARMKVEAA